MGIHDLILEELNKKYKVKRSGTWYAISCPFCGDSAHGRAQHLCLKIPTENDPMFGMNCFKPGCDASGIVGVKELMTLGITNPEIIKFVKNNHTVSLIKYRTEEMRVNKFTIPYVEPATKVNDYFKDRTNVNLSEDICNQLRVIPDMRSFIDKNKDGFSVKDIRLKYLYDHPDSAVVFINDTGTRLYVRYVDGYKKHDKIPLVDIPWYIRHRDYTLSKNVDWEKDIMRINIFIGEGNFDIVNTYLHITSPDIRAIFHAAGGIKSFERVFLEYSRYYYDVVYIFLKDKDISKSFFENLYTKYNYRFKQNPYILYSENTKDLGNIKENFKPMKERLEWRTLT